MGLLVPESLSADFLSKLLTRSREPSSRLMITTSLRPAGLPIPPAHSLDRKEHMFYPTHTRFAGQVRNRCSSSTCPGWYTRHPHPALHRIP